MLLKRSPSPAADKPQRTHSRRRLPKGLPGSRVRLQLIRLLLTNSKSVFPAARQRYHHRHHLGQRCNGSSPTRPRRPPRPLALGPSRGVAPPLSSLPPLPPRPANPPSTAGGPSEGPLACGTLTCESASVSTASTIRLLLGSNSLRPLGLLTTTVDAVDAPAALPA